MKRSNPTRAKTHIPSDFKRLKAKVGKRAPDKLNATDTKFQTATVKVQSQTISKHASTNSNIVDPKSLLLACNKGKHLSQMLAQLNHPAPAARLSALHGLKETIASPHSSVAAILEHLSVLIPSLSKGLVDDDGKVRSMARNVLFQILPQRMGYVASPTITPSKTKTNETETTATTTMTMDWCEGQGNGRKMKPFLPLTLAYIGSALNSLDSDVRYHGCLALEQLCTIYKQICALPDENQKLEGILPGFSMLLTDVGGGLASIMTKGRDGGGVSAEDTKKKRKAKKEDTNASRKVMGILRSLIAVLKIVGDGSAREEDFGSESIFPAAEFGSISNKQGLPSTTLADLSYLQGGIKANAILIHSENTKNSSVRSQRRIVSLNDLQHLSKTFSTSRNAMQTIKFSMLVSKQKELLSKMRDRFVEVTQRGHSRGDNKGMYLSSGNIEECILSVTAIRLLWSRYCRHSLLLLAASTVPTKDLEEYKRLRSTGNGVLKLFLECLPIKDDSGNPSNQDKYGLLNALLSCTMSEFGSVLTNPSSDSSPLWVDSIFSYLIPMLEESSTSGNKVMLLKVIEHLLLKKEVITGDGRKNRFNLLDDDEKQLTLLLKFGEAYFPASKDVSGECCRSAEGRRAAYLLNALVVQTTAQRINLDDSSPSGEVWCSLLQMVSVLPHYIQEWNDGFPSETTAALATLLSLSRRHPVSGQKTCDTTSHYSMRPEEFIHSIRDSMTSLFTKTSDKRRIFGNTYKLSTFEKLPESSQRLTIGIIGLLQYPSETLMTCLANICARTSLNRQLNEVRNIKRYCFLSDDIADLVMSVMHSVRRTMPMQRYMTFLISATGINSAKYTSTASKGSSGEEKVSSKGSSGEEKVSSKGQDESNDNFDFIFLSSYDKGIARSCRYLTECNQDGNILKILKPMMMFWFENAKGAEYLGILDILRTRAGFCVLAAIALDQNIQRMGATISILENIPDVGAFMSHTISLIFSKSLAKELLSDGDLSNNFLRIVKPIMVSISDILLL